MVLLIFIYLVTIKNSLTPSLSLSICIFIDTFSPSNYISPPSITLEFCSSLKFLILQKTAFFLILDSRCIYLSLSLSLPLPPSHVCCRSHFFLFQLFSGFTLLILYIIQGKRNLRKKKKRKITIFNVSSLIEKCSGRKHPN